MSMYTINVDFAKAKRQADKLDDLARELRAVANNNLESTLCRLAQDWSGESANLFRKKGNELKKELLNTAKKMERTADEIRLSAKKIYDAERRALEIAQKKEAAKTGALNGGSSGGRF